MAFTPRKSVLLLSAGAACMVLAGMVAVRWMSRPAPPATEVAGQGQSNSPTSAPSIPSSPALYCVFYDFTHASIVVGFDFAVDLPKGRPPRFFERAEAVRRDPPTTFDTDPPTWPYAPDEDGTPTITSPDGATRILLYGLKLHAGGILLIDAGIRSNDFRNLDGQCRQAFFGGAG